jgi:beta-galactosidase GanA
MATIVGRGEKLEPELLERWKKNGSKPDGTWAQVFGDDEWGQEVFTAWHYARFTEGLLKAGKARYDIPMYVNVALNRTGRKPGEYPSGGPLPHLMEGRSAVARLPRARHLLPELLAARGALSPRG